MTPEEYFPPEIWTILQKIGIRITTTPSPHAPNVLLGLYLAEALPEGVGIIEFYKDFHAQTGKYFVDATTPFFSDFSEAFNRGFDTTGVGQTQDHAVFAATAYIHTIDRGFEWTRQETNVTEKTTLDLIEASLEQLVKRVDPDTGLTLAKLANIPEKVRASLNASGFNLRVTHETPEEFFNTHDVTSIHQEYEELGGQYATIYDSTTTDLKQIAWNTVWVFSDNDYTGQGAPPDFFEPVTGQTPIDPEVWPQHVQVVIDVVKKITNVPDFDGTVPGLILLHALFINGYLVRPGNRRDHTFETNALLNAYLNSMPLIAGTDIDPTSVLEGLVNPVLKQINEQGYNIVPNIHLVYGVNPHKDFQLLPRQVKNAKEVMRTLKRTQKRPLTDVEVDKLAINIKKMFKHHLGNPDQNNEAFFVNYEDELLHDRTVSDVEPLFNVLRYLTEFHAPAPEPRVKSTKPKPKKFSEVSAPTSFDPPEDSGRSLGDILGDALKSTSTAVPVTDPEPETGINPETGKLHYITGYKGGFCSPRRPVFGDAVPVPDPAELPEGTEINPETGKLHYVQGKTCSGRTIYGDEYTPPAPKPKRDAKGKFLKKETETQTPTLKRRGCS